MPDAGGLTNAERSEFDELLHPESAHSAAPLPGANASGAVAASAPSAAPGAPRGALELAVPKSHTVAPTFEDFRAGWKLGLYKDPILCGVLAGAVLGMIGVFVVLRRAVFVTAAISQAAGLGVALAFLLAGSFGIALPPIACALALSLATTALLAARSERWRMPRESVLGFAYVVASAGAVLVGDRITQEAQDVSSILFGTAVLVRPEDLIGVAVVGAIVVTALIVCWRGLVFAGFDPECAQVHGLPVRALDLLLWTLVALETSVATRAIGALPVFGFAILPAMGALAIVESLRTAVVIAALIGGAAGGLGYLFAFFYEFPVGASQATLATLILLVCLPIARLRPRVQRT